MGDPAALSGCREPAKLATLRARATRSPIRSPASRGGSATRGGHLNPRREPCRSHAQFEHITQIRRSDRRRYLVDREADRLPHGGATGGEGIRRSVPTSRRSRSRAYALDSPAAVARSERPADSLARSALVDARPAATRCGAQDPATPVVRSARANWIDTKPRRCDSHAAPEPIRRVTSPLYSRSPFSPSPPPLPLPLLPPSPLFFLSLAWPLLGYPPLTEGIP